jgi:purine-nucleoside phosphorylase
MNADVQASSARLLAAADGEFPPLALLLGSGWGALADRLQPSAEVGYDELPAFPAPGVAGHAGVLRLGRLAGVPVCLLGGRKHAYEDGDAAAMKGAIRSLAAAGVRVLLQTNAAGSLDPALPAGSLMLIGDHLNVAQRTPLHGEPGNDRFVDMADAYCPRLRAQALRAAQTAGVPLGEGVYAWVLGPQFETPAEIRMLQRLGARAVGMSTVPETILARHAGLRVLALSMITNMGCGLSDETLSHAHTLAGAQAMAADAARLLEALLPMLETRP